MSGDAMARSMEERLVRLLHREIAASREELAETHSRPIEERVETGHAIEARFLGWEANGSRLLLDCADNLSKFREGDRLLLGDGDDPGSGVPVVYLSYDASAGRLLIEKDRWNAAGWESLDPAGRIVLDRAGGEFGAAILEAVGIVYGGSDERSRRIRSILDRSAVVATFDPGERIRALRIAERSALDSSQREAFIAGFSARPLHLVQGPPGSGKTHLVACLASIWARSGERVLVTAYTHRAVNNVLRAVATIEPAIEVVKVGEPHHSADLPTGVRRVRSAKNLVSPARGRGQVTGATVFALRALWEETSFARVVFDEAAQIPVPHAICGMLAGERYLFVGDHRQLGPIVVAVHDDPIARLSIFEHLVEPGPAGALPPSVGDPREPGGRSRPPDLDREAEERLGGPVGERLSTGERGYEATLLRRTYRMNAGINAFPSRAFYSGALVADEEAGRRVFPHRPGGPFDDLLDPERPAVIASIAHEGARTRSLAEARLVADLVAELLTRQKVPPEQIAVVTPYRAQIRAIRTLLQLRLGADALSSRIPMIDTVERIQGQERDIVVVSLVCSEPEYAAQEAEFLFSANRLNVTLTRARTKLVIVMSPHLLRALPADLENLRRASLFVRLWRELPKIEFTERYADRG